MKIIQYLSCIFLFNFQTLVSQSFSWEKVNSLYGGKVYTLMKDSINSIYAGTGNGVFKTNNLLTPWELISTEKFNVDELTFINQNYFLCSNQTELMYSTNQGNSWDVMFSSPQGSTISSIYEKNSNLFVGTGGLTFLFSSDMGNTWDTTNLNGLFGWSYDFITAFEVVNDSILFVGSDGSGMFILPVGSLNRTRASYLPLSIFDFEQSDSDKIYCGTSNGVYLSTDIGETWAMSGIEGRKIFSIKNYNNYVFAGTDSGVYISNNYGLNWELKSFGNIYPTIFDILIVNSEKLCAATSLGIYFSLDNGNTWSLNNYGIDAVGAIFDFLITNDTIFLATNSGFYISHDSGQSWERKGVGLNQDMIMSIVQDKNANLYAGTNVGVFKSTNYGEEWNYILSGTFLRNVESFNDVVFAAKAWNSQGIGIYRSSDHGSSWQIISDIEGTINSFCLLPNDYIMAGGDSLYISSDSGITWNQLPSPVWGGGQITELKSIQNYIYIGSEIAGVFISTDVGKNWTPLGLEWLLISAIDAYRDSIFIGINNAVNDPDPVGPFLSTNRGTTWTTINQGFENTSILSFSFDSRGYLLAGSRDGLYISSEIIATNIKDESFDLPSKFSLSQNYPNPFNPSTKISWQSPVGSWQTLKVYDILGNEVVTLVNEYKNAGSYNFEFNASHLASGIYYYQLRAGDYVETRKMILIK